ncbi:MAG TPA: sugar transferase [Gemmatimonadaceae bacterium]|nr:sugar transferase [Gemmatimonadaceae bacterium]
MIVNKITTLRSLLKRVVSSLAALAALVLLLPVLLVLMILVRTQLGTPMLFTQLRPGLRGKPFRLVKFRSMTSSRNAQGELLPDAQRLTPFGRRLRSTSLDELPSLWNIVVGDINFIGPRPLLMEYLPLYSARQARRHDVKPGLTGWAQINGRNSLSWDDKLELDVWYVEHQSPALDLHILARTVLQVLRRHGVTASGDVTMPKFRGSPHREGA